MNEWMMAQQDTDKLSKTTNIDVEDILKGLKSLKEALKSKTAQRRGGLKDSYDKSKKINSLVDDVIDTVTSLNDERLGLLHELEIAAIMLSKLRLMVVELPKNIKREEDKLREAAEEVVAKRIKQTQSETQKLREATELLDDKHVALERENESLKQQINGKRELHMLLIKELNDDVSVRSTKQINLNNLRHKIKKTEKEVADVNESIVTFQENFEEEKLEATKELNNLHDVVVEIQKLANAQKEKNGTVKAQCQKLTAELERKKSEYLDTVTEIDTRQAATMKRRQSKKDLKERLVSHEKEEKKLEEKSEVVRIETENVKKEFEAEKKQIKKKLNNVQIGLDKVKLANEKLVSKSEKVQVAHDEVEKVYNADVEEINRLEKNRSLLQTDIEKKAEECGELATQIIDLEDTIELDAEEHEMQNKMLEDMICKSSYDLSVEQKRREAREVERDTLQCNLQKLSVDHTKVMPKLETRREHALYYAECLEEELGKAWEKVNTLSKTMTELSTDVQEKVKEFSILNENLECEAANIEETVERHAEFQKSQIIEMANETEQLHELQEAKEETAEEYNVKQKEVDTLRVQQRGIEAEINEGKAVIKKLQQPRALCKVSMENESKEFLEMLQRQAVGSKTIELNIRTYATKLRRIRETNCSLYNAILKVKAQCENIVKDRANGEVNKQHLLECISFCKEIFSEKRRNADIMNELYADKDSQLIKAVTEVLAETRDRDGHVSYAVDQLGKRIVHFGTVLLNAEVKRPIESSVELASIQKGAQE